MWRMERVFFSAGPYDTRGTTSSLDLLLHTPQSYVVTFIRPMFNEVVFSHGILCDLLRNYFKVIEYSFDIQRIHINEEN